MRADPIVRYTVETPRAARRGRALRILAALAVLLAANLAPRIDADARIVGHTLGQTMPAAPWRT